MASTAQPRPSDKYIPWLIVLFFIVLAVVFAGFAYIANKTFTGVVTEQAYTKGLAYNQVIKKSEQQETLQFTSAIEFKNDIVIFTLKNKQGQGVKASKVTLFLYRPIQEGSDFSQDMTMTEQGRYSAKINPPQNGLWELRIHAETAAGVYQTSQRTVFK